jgi:amino acid permease
MTHDIDPALLLSKDDMISNDETDHYSKHLFNMPTPANASLFQCFQVLVNSAIGSGTLMIPYCYTCGIILAFSISLLFAGLSFLSMHLLIDTAFTVGHYDYNGLFDYCFGRRHRWLINLCIVVVQLGAFMIYAHWNGSLINRLIGSTHFLIGSDTFWIFLVTTLVVYPLTLLRQISKLDKVSTMSTVFVTVLVVHAIYWLVRDVSRSGFDPDGSFTYCDFRRWQVIIAAFGINCMAYACHLNLFPVLETLRECTLRRGYATGGATVLCAFVMYNALGVIAYCDKGGSLGPVSILEAYDRTNPFTIVVTAGVIVILIGSSPAVCWALRNSVNVLLFKDASVSNLRWIAVGGVVSLTGAFLASTSDRVLIFFDLVGGLIQPVVTLTLPGIFYLKCKRNATRTMRALAWFVIIFSLVGCVASTYQAVMEIVDAVTGGVK